MSDDQNPYRPRSPDFSSLGNQDPHPIQPPPRLGRLPTYQIQEPSLPKGYSFSPRGSYDASPFFSPVTQQPHPSYFNFPPVPSPQVTPAGPSPPPPPPQPTHPHHPHQPQLPPQPQPHQQTRSQPILQSPYSQSPPRLTHQSSTGTPNPKLTAFAAQSPPFSAIEHQQLIDDMARLRQRKPVNYSEDHPVSHEYEEPAPMPSLGSQALPPPAPYPPHHQPPVPLAEPFPAQYLFAPASKVPTKIDVRTKFPVARIKRIMQADEDVGKVAQATPSAVSKALELFMIALVTKGAAEAKTQNSKRITATHLKNSLLKDPQFDFLSEVCESAPDEGSKKRAKSETKDTDSEDEGDAKRKAKGRKKKTGSEMESD